MQVLFSYGDLMPKELFDAIDGHTDFDLEKDFEDNDTDFYGNYWLGDTSDCDYEKYAKEEGIEYDPEKHEQGYFTWDDVFDILGFYDSIAPEQKKGCWHVEGNGPWADGQISINSKYLAALAKYSK